MEQFSLEKWLQDKSRKVVTRDGRPVRIVCADSPIPHHPIAGFVECDLFTWTDDGKVIYDGKREDKNDLFFADEENRLTEFENKLLAFALMFNANIEEEKIEYVKECSKTLLDSARKELEKKYCIDKDGGDREDVYERCKQDTYKDLPKLEKAKDILDPSIPVIYTNAASMKSYVEYNGYKLCINDIFEKLTKENVK